MLKTGMQTLRHDGAARKYIVVVYIPCLFPSGLVRLAACLHCFSSTTTLVDIRECRSVLLSQNKAVARCCYRLKTRPVGMRVVTKYIQFVLGRGVCSWLLCITWNHVLPRPSVSQSIRAEYVGNTLLSSCQRCLRMDWKDSSRPSGV